MTKIRSEWKRNTGYKKTQRIFAMYDGKGIGLGWAVAVSVCTICHLIHICMFVRVFIHASSCEFAPSLRSPLISSIITPMINSWIYHKNKDSTFIMMHHLSPFLLCCMPIFRFAWKSDCTLLWTTMIQCWTLLCELFSNQVE